MVALDCWELLSTSNSRHSSVGWNPVHRIFKHLDGLVPSLRWDDGVSGSSLLILRKTRPAFISTVLFN